MVTLSSTQMNRPALFRTIETIADLLAEALARSGELAASYDFYGGYLFELDLVDSLHV